jgi:uncharacterized RDD family membrane protein YckC
MKESFNTSAGRVEVLVDEQSRTVSVYRFDAAGRPAAAAIESWDYTDLADLLTRQTGVSAWEANEIASGVKARLALVDAPAHADTPRWGERRRREQRGSMENAGIPLRFVAVLLDGVIVFFPAGIILGLLFGGGWTETGSGYANAGIDLGGKAAWLLLALGVGYYVLCEAATGATLGKRIVGIHVVGEDGDHLTFEASLVRNLVRLVDCLFFYLVGGIFALTSPHGQRLGDRAAHTLVVRR